MKLVKYSKSGSGKSAGAAGAGSGGSSSTTNISGGSASLARTIWGQYDEGDDVDGSMTVHGNIHIQVIDEKTYDPDDEGDDGEDVEDETGGGSLFVDENVEVGKHLYINYSHPGHESNKKCVGELLSGHETEINSLKTRVSTAETNISNNTTEINSLKTRVSTNETNISNNTTEINNLKASNLTTEDVLQLIRDNQPSALGSYNQPVILFTGRARRVSYYSDRYYIEGIKLPHFSLTNVIDQGLMTITVTADEGYQVNIYGVQANQERSGDTGDTIEAYHKGRSDGAHWFECRVDSISNTNKVYIKEFHQGNGDNDTWYSDNWYGDGGVKAVHFTLMGYILPTT